MFKKLAESLCNLANEVAALREQKKKEFEWFKAHNDLATKRDLQNAEYRIIDAFNSSIGADDQRLLDALLDRTERQLQKLEALDAKTPPPV